MGNLPVARTATLNPGDAVPSALLNELQDRDIADNARQTSQIMLTDQILQSMAGSVANSATRPDFGGDDGANVSTLWAYCISPGHAFLRQGSANNKIQVAPGTLLQKVANSDGTTLVLIPFTFAGTEEWTLANGDATNPRVDLLQMKLTYAPSTSTPSAQLTVKQGTPAGSPTIPDPDAGFVPVGTVVVGQTWTSASTAPIFGVDTASSGKVVVHDQRMPLGVSRYVCDPVMYKLDLAWALSAINTGVLSSSGTNRCFVPCYVNRPGRLIGVDVTTDTTITAGAITMGGYPTGSNSLSGNYQKGNTFAGSAIFGTVRHVRAQRKDIDGAHNPSAGPTIQQSATNKIGVPLWTSGRRTPQIDTNAQAPANTPGWLMLAIQNQTNGTTLGETAFWVAS